MTTKEYLRQLPDLKKEIQAKVDEISMKRMMMTSISINTENERVQSSSDPDNVSNMIANILEMESELNSQVEKARVLESKITNQINEIDNAKQRTILFCKYVQGHTFEQTAVVMNLGWRQTINIHGDALHSFEKKFGKEYL